MKTMRTAWALQLGVFLWSAWVPAVEAQQRSGWTRHTIDSTSLGADGVRAADANGDGLIDLVSSWEQGDVTRVYLRVGPPETPRWRTVTIGRSPSAEDAAFVDVDGDDVLDVVSATEGSARKILVHWAPPVERLGSGTAWRTEVLYEDGTQWMFTVPMDVDSRRGIDLVIGGKNEGATIGWLEAPERPLNVAEWTYHPLSEAGWVMSLLVRDMNSDGLADILLSDRRGPLAGVRWLENPGHESGAFGRWRNHWVGARGREAMFIDVADLDGDGTEEIVVPHFLGGDYRLSVFRKAEESPDGEMWTETLIPYPPTSGRPKAVSVGDIDLDGQPDLVLASAQAYGERHGIEWLRFRGSPYGSNWEVFDVSGADGEKFDLNLLLDVDADGDLDVINSEEHDNALGGEPGLGVVWYENPTRRPGGM